MHTQFVSDCVFPHTDNLLITGSGDGTTALWDIETASMIQGSHHTNELNIVCKNYLDFRLIDQKTAFSPLIYQKMTRLTLTKLQYVEVINL